MPDPALDDASTHRASSLLSDPAARNPQGDRSRPIPGLSRPSPDRHASARRIPESPARRKLDLLARSAMFGRDLRGAEICRACNREDLAAAYRLVHQVYLAVGYLKPEPSGIRLRIFEASPETATFVAKVEGRVVAVLSVVADTPESGLPSDGAFKAELDGLRRRRLRLCEMTNQVVAEGFRHTAIPAELMRAAGAHCIQMGYSESVATVSPGHTGFYRLLGFRALSSVRSYGGPVEDPVVALSMNLEKYRSSCARLSEGERFVRRELTEENPFFPRVVGWIQQAHRSFLDAELLEELFVRERNFLAECTPGQLETLCRRWGHELFEAVCACATAALGRWGEPAEDEETVVSF